MADRIVDFDLDEEGGFDLGPSRDVRHAILRRCRESTENVSKPQDRERDAEEYAGQLAKIQHDASFARGSSRIQPRRTAAPLAAAATIREAPFGPLAITSARWQSSPQN